MKNNIYRVVLIVATIALFNTNPLIAQVTSNGESKFIHVVSYNGVTVANAFTYRVVVSGTNINYPNWALMVRANPPITNSEGKIIDPSKISIRLNNITGGPSIQSIGASTASIPLSFSDQPFFQKSNYPIKHGPNDYYSQYVFSFDIIVKDGEYLQALKSNSNHYQLGLTFTVLKANKELLTQSVLNVGMRIFPTDTPPVQPTYSIQINSNARNGLLEFKTISDYVNGVSQTYQNGLSITSTTPYAVQVKSLSSNLQSNNSTLPVNTVSVNIKDPNSAIGGTIALSENTQTVFNAINNGTNARLFDIRYFTQPNDERMLNSKPDNYQTTLTYTLLPQ